MECASFASDKLELQTVKTLNLQVKTVTLHMKGEQRKHNWNAAVGSCVICRGRHLCCVCVGGGYKSRQCGVISLFLNITLNFRLFVEGESNYFNCYYF